MQKIFTHLWYEQQARETAELYASTFPNSKVTNLITIHNTPSNDVDIVTFELLGREFQAIGGGPMFKFNPSISLLVQCKSKEEVDAYWQKLSPGGMALMELGSYPFSERFGWLQDQSGLSWQFLYEGPGAAQKITPVLMFVGDVCGKAEEAIQLWTSLFPDSREISVTRYGNAEAPDREGTLKTARFSLFGQEFGAMDSAYDHRFAFNEAISLVVRCDTQAEIDHYWNSLSADPAAEACGWLKDKFGVSWQIVPTILDELMGSGDQEKADRLTQAILPMKKLVISELQAAYEG